MFSRNLATALALGEEIEAGSVWINNIHRSNHNVPFGGMKESGIGREKGRYGIESYLEYKTLYLVLRRSAGVTDFLAPDDIAIWLCAKPWLDVRSNDEHTLDFVPARAGAAARHPDADDRIVLPAVFLHDVGWKMFPEEKLARCRRSQCEIPRTAA